MLKIETQRGISIFAQIAIAVVRFYQIFLSPFLMSQCRFYPSCSEYAIEAVTKFGVFRGGLLTVGRIARCNPFCEGGYDPPEWR
ncbi:MAG: membrane protein insertion efficiency factor YidD [Deltaproteobacteria bacterium]|nr:membrane protein insertion efficiency factor YidD [Deltaproteobacteria bacterium]